MVDLKEIQSSLIGFETRAEKVSAEKLTETFVDAEPLFALLSTNNHQVVFGRRGTGKTHALRYLAQSVENKGDVPIYIDLRTVGSNGSIYADQSISLEERTSTLLIDVLVSLHDNLLEVANSQRSFIDNPAVVTKAFDAFAEVITTVRVVGETTLQTESNVARETQLETGLNVTLSNDPGATATLAKSRSSSESSSSATKTTGRATHYLQFGAVQNALARLIEALGITKIWLLLDEWSEIPIALQPYLADMLRRTVLPTPTVIVKIAAIEHRCNFMLPLEQGAYVGIELGADAGADLNLDDFMVFDNDSSRSVEFFKNLVFKHLNSSSESSFSTPD